MGEGLPDAAMPRRGTAQVVMLPRDPEMAYVYWEWPLIGDEGGTLTVYVEGAVDRHAVASFEITEESGGRFVTFGQPGAAHVCALESGDESRESAPVEAPRRESGDEKPRFVRVALTEEEGLAREPAEHEHAVRGRFPGADTAAPSSGAPTRNTTSR